MRRRDFLSGIAASSMVGSGVSLRSARAQQAGRIYHVGAISFLSRETPHYVAFFDELRKAGFIENQNMKVDLRGFDLRGEKVAQVAAALVEDKVDILITGGDALIRAAQKATRTIPILAVTDDMVSTGLVRSLSNPGGNITGVSIFAPELDRKRLDLLFELIPAARRIALLLDSGTTAPAQVDALKKIAASRGVELTAFAVSTPDEIRAAVLAAKAANAEALNVLASVMFLANRRIVISAVDEVQLPAIYQWSEMTDDGGLIAYGPRLVDIYKRQLSRQFIKLMQGVKPADIPVEQPDGFELTVNLKTAERLKLTVPTLLLNRADKVVE